MNFDDALAERASRFVKIYYGIKKPAHCAGFDLLESFRVNFLHDLIHDRNDIRCRS